MPRTVLRRCALTFVVLAMPAIVSAQSALSGPTIRIARATGPIIVDGQLGDAGWQKAARVDKFFETNPGDNVEPKVRSVGYLAYDDRFFYAAFEFDDPDPGAIRAPFSDRDNISGNGTDYGGIILDTRNDGHSGVLLLATPRGIQYDAATDDASGEDSSPDFFWDAAARITDKGWTLEIRVPFSSLRYKSADPQTWGIMLYRNYPRDFRYQMFSMQLPRGGNCFVCRANRLVGLERLPGGGHVIAAPYVSGSSDARPENGLGSPLGAADTRVRGGLDVKWTPTADNAIDLTVKPDFSQVESDTAQISTNERFALFFPEKRTFFLEGVELLSTPVQAVYTRTVTAPRWGSRLTGKIGGIGYTALFADDEGGGSVIIPGPDNSDLADQASGSYTFIARAKREIGRSFVSMLLTDRESRGSDAHNRVIGPDFQWRPSAADVITAQWLYSHTTTPTRPDLAEEWTGQSFAGHASHLEWSRNTRRFDAQLGYWGFGRDFRADTGFVPQVGYRQTYHNAGWTIRPNGAVRRVRFFVNTDRQVDEEGDLITGAVAPGVGLDVKFSGSLQARYIDDRVRSNGVSFRRKQFAYRAGFSPTRRIRAIGVDGRVGDEVDFANGRLGQGASVNFNATVNATDHLELSVVHSERSLDVDSLDRSGRLFRARVSRVRGIYNFTARSFVRAIAQYVSTIRDPALYLAPATPRSGAFSS